MPVIRFSFLLMVFGILCSCSGKKADAGNTPTQKDTANAEMQVTLDGTLYVTEKVDWQSSHANDVKDQIQFLLWNSKDPVQLNLNINKEILKKGSGTYTIPEANSGKIMIDLNFYNQESPAKKKMNKRIIFKKGTIEFVRITDHTLQMRFEGEGKGMMQRGENFPISGEVNVNY